MQAVYASGRIPSNQLYHQDGIRAQPGGVRVGAGPWLGVAINDDWVGYGRQGSGGLNGMRTGAGDVKGNGVRARIGVGLLNGRPQGALKPRSAQVGIADGVIGVGVAGVTG